MSDEFSDIGFMFDLTTVTEGAGSFERRLTDQVDGLVEMLARMLCATSKVYIPVKVTDRQRKALYKFLEQHCRDKMEAIGTSDWVFDDATEAELRRGSHDSHLHEPTKEDEKESIF